MKILLLLICSPAYIFCQNSIGLPDVINYSKLAYSGGLQNWDIKQDKNAIIYVANNEGLLSYNGKNWNLYPLPNKTIVRSVEISSDHKIYVGGQDELGYFSPSANGQLKYHSLTRFIPVKDRSFGDVWDILIFKKDIFFRSLSKIFKFTIEAVAIYNAPSEWSFTGICNGHLFAHDSKTGLLRFDSEVWKPLFEMNELPVNDPVTGILQLKENSTLISTLKNGLFILSERGISKLPSVNNKLFESERIYAATSLDNEWIALATNNSGVYIIDQKGNLIQSFSQKEGLQNNNVLSIFMDSQRNLWLGLDNGIDLITFNSAIKQINPSFQDGAGYTSIIHNSRLFIGTSNGVYSVLLQPLRDLSFSKGIFTPVNNTKGQAWTLNEINNRLLLGHHEGAFEIKGNNALSISADPGFWNFVPMSGVFPVSKLIAGNYNGLNIFDFIKGQFIPGKKIPGFPESSRFVMIDREDQIWVSHPYHGIFKINTSNETEYTINAYTEINGLPSRLNNHVYKIKNDVVVATETGVFIYNPGKDHFEPSLYYRKLLGDQSIRYLKEDIAGNIWFIHEKSLGVIDLSGKEPSLTYLPELNNKMLSGFEFIYPLNDNNIFLGGEKGFYHINYEKYKEILPKLQAKIREVRIINQKDSVLFGGYINEEKENQFQNAENIDEVSYQWNAIQFEFSSSLFGYQSNLEYKYRLRGFEDNWSDWAKRTEKEYTNIPAGSYSFEVKVRSSPGNESETALFAFEILPPWYQTTWAKILILLFLGTSIFAIVRWQKKKFKSQQVKHEEEQKRLLYIHELELNKTEIEIVALRNEKLEAEINFKNSEVASSAMHLVKKGELLSRIKSELSQVIKGLDNPPAAAGLKKMIKTLIEDDNMDKDWENFAKHFDKVHGDFVVGLKGQHPTITPNELKLCAYLRMNLSTKEIAQLMNISVRGVEISRYRLRKKLGISSDINLFDFLIKSNSKP